MDSGHKQYMNKELEQFLLRHNISVVDTNKRFAKYKPTYKYFDNKDDYNIISSECTHQSEPLYTVQIPLSDLERLAEFEDQVFGNMKQLGHYGLFQNLMELKEEELRLRREFPAVQKAYESYSLMLNLCKGNKDGTYKESN